MKHKGLLMEGKRESRVMELLLNKDKAPLFYKSGMLMENIHAGQPTAIFPVPPQNVAFHAVQNATDTSLTQHSEH